MIKELTEAWQKGDTFLRIMMSLVCVMALVLFFAIGVFVWDAFHPGPLPLVHLNGSCANDLYRQHTVYIGKAVIQIYEQVKVCP